MTNLMLFIAINFLLEARAEIQKYFGLFFGSNDNFRICFRDLLTFRRAIVLGKLVCKAGSNKKGQKNFQLQRFLNPFLQLAAEKRDSKNGAAIKFFGPSYFFMALVTVACSIKTPLLSNMNLVKKVLKCPNCLI